ncbi:hypothetical protein RRF57_013098 [Xylaria bambusicola]|uniref:Uncharacterized protein n=1 Tax=Xylaria bambusicola TaxID=326684 RepID=A0AAN7ZE20_9PEZI
MTQCPDGTYCCGQNELGCCGTDRAIDIPTQGSVVSSGAHNTSSNTSNAFKNATIGLAVALGVVAIFATGVIAWLFHQNKAMKKQLLEKGEEASHLPPPVVVHPYSSTYEPATPQMKDPSMPESPSMASGVLVGRRHFSELDGSMSATRSEMGSPVQHDYFNGEASPRSFYSHSATAHVGPSQ